MLIGDDFPELGTDLVAALSCNCVRLSASNLDP